MFKIILFECSSELINDLYDTIGDTDKLSISDRDVTIIAEDYSCNSNTFTITILETYFHDLSYYIPSKEYNGFKVEQF